VSFTAGAGTASVTLVKAETVSLTATQGAVTGTTPATFAVSPAVASKFSVPTPAGQTAGVAFNVSVTAQDAFSNTATGYTGSQALVFTGPANAPSGATPTYPAAVSFTAGAGTASVTLVKAETVSLTATQGGLTGTTAAGFTISPAAESQFAVSNPGTRTAGAPFVVAVIALDAYRNVAVSYTGAHTVAWSGPANAPNGTAPTYPSSATALTFSGGNANANGITLFNASTTTTLTATEGSLVGTSTSFTVNAAAASQFAVSNPGTQTSNVAFGVTVSALDAYKNVASYSGAHTIVWSGPANSPAGNAPTYPASATSLNFTGGTASATGIRLFNASTNTTLTATEGSFVGTSASFAVTAAAQSQLAFTTNNTGSTPTLAACNGGTESGLAPNTSRTLYVMVLDAYGNATTQLTNARSVSVSKPGSSSGSDGTIDGGNATVTKAIAVNANPAVTASYTLVFNGSNSSKSAAFTATSTSPTTVTSATCTLHG
jgi:hypothetical protein